MACIAQPDFECQAGLPAVSPQHLVSQTELIPGCHNIEFQLFDSYKKLNVRKIPFGAFIPIWCQVMNRID